MTPGGRTAGLVVLWLILGTVAVPGNVQSDFGNPPEPRSTFAVDVPTWFAGDTWTYSAHLYVRMGQNVTNLVGSITFLVSSFIEERQNGTLYEAYNVTLTGSLTGTGRAVISGLTADIVIQSATLAGYQWVDRSDLSLVRDNETIDASGYATVVFPIPRYPLSLKFFNTGNRSPSQEDYDFPLLPGDAPRFAGNMRIIGSVDYSVTGTPFGDFVGTFPYDHNTTMDFDARLEGVEDITAGGNVYHSYHITETPPGGGSPTELWYAPAVKNNARWYLVASNIDFVVGGFINLTWSSTGQPPFPLAINLDPQTVNPGGYLNVTGTTVADSRVRVRTPWNESFLDTVADSGGAFGVRIRAPTFNDNTPSNADVGSFGVPVEATHPVTPTLVSYNTSTIVLLLPDLSVTPADLSFATPPQVGVLNSIRAVVRESPNVGVTNSVPAEFLLDGGHFATDSTPFIAQGGRHMLTAPFTPLAGIHTIGVRVDPLNTIIESDKSNNNAEMPLDAMLPDLVPWNITIRDGVTAAYANPAATGYVSDWFNASWGESLTITFQMMNRGNASASGQTRVIVVETNGLRGPPTAAPLYDSTGNITLAPNESIPFGPATWNVPLSDGQHFFNVTVDADNSMAESSEGNNTFVVRVSIGAPDLVISVTGPPKVPVGTQWSSTITVRNSGNAASPPTALNVTNATSGAFIGTLGVSSLSPGQSDSPVFTFTSQESPASYCFRFEVDPGNAIVEKNESNNRATTCLNVTSLPITTLTLSGQFIQGATQLYITNRTDMGFTVTDRSGEGIRNTMYKVDSGTWTAYNAAVPINIPTEGAHTITYNSTDKLGGAEDSKTAGFFVDDIAPVSNAARNGTSITINATDDVGSGVANIFYSVDSGRLTVYNGTFVVMGAGHHVVEFYSTDRLQNTEKLRNVSFSIQGESTGAGENLKPYIAVLFAVVLMAVGLLVWRKRGEHVALVTSIIFIAAEVATGIASLFVDPLVYSPAAGKTLALYVDLAVLVIGVAAIWVTRRPGGTAEKSEAPAAKPVEPLEESQSSEEKP